MFPELLCIFLILVLGGSGFASLLTGRFFPWSSTPIIYKRNPTEFLLYVGSCLLIVIGLALSLWKWVA